MIKKNPVIELRDRYLELSTASRLENDKVILKDLRQLIEHAYRENEWWRQRIKTRMTQVENAKSIEATLARIPITKRSDVQVWGQAAWVVPEAKQPGFDGRFPSFSTSGSTGEPVVGIRKMPLYSILQNALILLEWTWFERKPNATISEIRVHGKIHDNTPYSVPLSYIGAGVRHGRSSTENNLDELLDFLEKQPADYLYVNGTTARLLALKAAAENRNIKLDQILTVSDRVDSNFRQLMDDVFGAEVVDRYSTEEFGTIAIQCPAADHLHVVEPTTYVELVDANNRPVAPGEVGRVLVTGLHTFALPLFRYEVGDFAVWETEPCPLGITWRSLKSITGRVRDTVIDESGNHRLVTFVDAPWLQIRSLFDQHVVRLDDAIVMFTKTSQPLTESEVAEIKSSLQKIFYTSDPVEILAMPETALLPTAKRREFSRVTKALGENFDAGQLWQELVQSAESSLENLRNRRVESQNPPKNPAE